MTENLYNSRFLAFDENFKRITEQIAEAACRSGRSLEEVTLLAATKTVPVEVINYAISHGLRFAGENRVQELLDKYEAFDKENCDLQFIGHLQTNKVKYIVDKVSCIQSVDSMKLAGEISRLSVQKGRTMNLLIEVNIGEEPQKGGVMPEALPDFLDELSQLKGIKVCGLMAIPPVCEKKAEACRYFSEMRQYFIDMGAKKSDNVSMECLSMGMSADFSDAIECGSTMVRIGSFLFGTRI